MKKVQLLAIALVLLATAVRGGHTVSIIPAPNSVVYRKGSFDLNRPVVLVASSPSSKTAAALFNEWLRQTTGKTFPVTAAEAPQVPSIRLLSIPGETGEQYRLVVNKKYIQLEGGPAGVVRGLSTLLQLVAQAAQQRQRIPALVIHDRPVFGYRGVHLDVCRHFVSKDFVKRYIDLMALHKMNTFHWHLTEDQGWRMEIKKYPRLTSVGAWRNGSMIGPYRDQQFDTLRYGGFYTQEEIREVVQYAADRAITVIPEIEMPGHSMAALAAYPQYSCSGKVDAVARGWGVFEDVFCAKDSTFLFLEDILTEVMALFPSTYIHIGGDECPKESWKKCSNCQAVMREKGLPDEHALQSYFIGRIEKFLNAHGRQIIGWDEILEGGLAPHATVMSWRGVEGGISAARAGHDAIMTPGSHCYFDHYQGERATEPLAIGGYTPLEKVYRYRPVPDSLTAEQARHIIGAQCNLWTEYMYDSQQVEYMLLPRLCALSEVLWTDTMLHSEQAFYQRLLRHERLLDQWKVNYATTWKRPTLQTSSAPILPGLEVRLSSKYPQRLMYAVTNGDEQPKQFRKYRRPFTIHATGRVLVRSSAEGGNAPVAYPFVFSRSTGAPVELLTPGDRQYANPGTTLTDGVTGVYPWTGKHWVGWYGKTAALRLDLGQEQQVDSIVVYYLHDPVSWIHAPQSIRLGAAGSGQATVRILPDQAIGRAVLPVGANLRVLPLFIESIGKNPAGSAGAGEDGWMFISEIQVY